MQAQVRQQRIEDYLHKVEFASLEELAKHVSASPSTVRRDLSLLESGGNVQPFGLSAAEHSPALAGVVALVDQLPPELLMGLSPEDYAALTVNLSYHS